MTPTEIAQIVQVLQNERQFLHDRLDRAGHDTRVKLFDRINLLSDQIEKLLSRIVP